MIYVQYPIYIRRARYAMQLAKYVGADRRSKKMQAHRWVHLQRDLSTGVAFSSNAHFFFYTSTFQLLDKLYS